MSPFLTHCVSCPYWAFMTNDKIRIFYSYSHKDESLRDALETHLFILKRQNIVEEWHDRKIRPGDSWESEIDTNIDKAEPQQLF